MWRRYLWTSPPLRPSRGGGFFLFQCKVAGAIGITVTITATLLPSCSTNVTMSGTAPLPAIRSCSARCAANPASPSNTAVAPRITSLLFLAEDSIAATSARATSCGLKCALVDVRPLVGAEHKGGLRGCRRHHELAGRAAVPIADRGQEGRQTTPQARLGALVLGGVDRRADHRFDVNHDQASIRRSETSGILAQNQTDPSNFVETTPHSEDAKMRAYTEVDDDQWALTETILDNPPSAAD